MAKGTVKPTRTVPNHHHINWYDDDDKFLKCAVADAHKEVLLADLAALENEFQRCRSVKSVSQTDRGTWRLRNRVAKRQRTDPEFLQGVT